MVVLSHFVLLWFLNKGNDDVVLLITQERAAIQRRLMPSSSDTIIPEF